jgi:sugar phosphate isomerase/epimerase
VTRDPGTSLAALDEAQLKALKQVQVNMPWRSLPDYLETIIDLQINIEIGLEAEQLDGVSRASFRAVAERLQRNGCRLTLHGPFWDLCPGSSDSLVRHVSHFRFHQLYDLVELFRPIQVVCHTGFDPDHHGGRHDGFRERSLAVWEPLVARAEALRVPLLLENVWEAGPELHRELLTAINSPYCGFCLDVGHQHSFSQAPLSVWVEILGEYLKEVHVHDNSGSHDDHLPVGQGTIAFDSFFELLRTRRLSPLITLEPHREEHLTESLAALVHVMDIDESATIA